MQKRAGGAPLPEQLRLPFAPPRDRLRRRLRSLLPEGARLVATDNRVSLVSFRRSTEETVVRVSDQLADSPDAILLGIARWVRGGRGSCKAGKLVRAYVASMPDGADAPRRSPLATRGRFHDLRPLLDKVMGDRFPEGVDVGGAGWGRAPRKARRRSGSVALASFQEATRSIRVHPALDTPEVLMWTLEFLLFHELLHAKLGFVRDTAGRARYHPAAFRALERSHPDYARFEAWETQELGAVLRRWDRAERSATAR